jgi:hypothetical protein
MKISHKLLYLKKLNSRAMSFYTVGRKREGETDFVSKLVHASIASHYDYDVLGSLHATV